MTEMYKAKLWLPHLLTLLRQANKSMLMMHLVVHAMIKTRSLKNSHDGVMHVMSSLKWRLHHARIHLKAPVNC